MCAKAMKNKGAVVITGAATGIGEMTALHLDKLGYRVFAGVYFDAYEKKGGEQLKAKASDRLSTVPLDVTDRQSIASAAKTVTDEVGEEGVVGLVNVHGIDIPGPLEFFPIDLLRRHFEVNVIGTMAVTQAFLPLLRKGKGRVINFGSMNGKMIFPLEAAYCASKAALEAMTDSLRMELRPAGIPVSVIEPGFIGTEMLSKSLDAWDKLEKTLPQEAHDRYGPFIDKAMKRIDRVKNMGSPPEGVAKLVAKALKAKTPKRRYRIGRGSRSMILAAKYVPEPILDWAIIKGLCMPKRYPV
jgi:NAD(P)-dependent dehydrogenase (short-subunit alcohol dehydrogenase family)